MRDWISLHVWYHDVARQDELILSCARPIIDKVQEREFVRRFFYIRYWDGGAHIRLRLLPHNGAADDCRALLDVEVPTYLNASPSRPPPGSVVWGRRGKTTVPDNSWQYVVYEPEFDRYGGEVGVELAEKHFEHSTLMAFEVLDRARQTADPTGAKLGYALQLASVLVLAAGFRGAMTYRFFEDCLHHVYIDEYDDDDYPAVFRRLREQLVSCFQRLEVLEVDWSLGGDRLVSQWGHSTASLLSELATHLETGPEVWQRSTPSLGSAKFKYVRIVHSYLHMLLNRLGFWGREEERILRLSRDAWQHVTLT